MSDYNLSLAETESMSLDFLLDLEFIDSKVDAAFEMNRRLTDDGKHNRVFIDQIL